MNLLEEKLRSGLAGLADEARANVRADALIGTFALIDRRRRNRRLLAGVAAATAAGVIGWTALAPHPLTVQPAPLATPSFAAGSIIPQYFQFTTDAPAVSHIVSVELRAEGSRLNLSVTNQQEYAAPAEARTFVAGAGVYFATKVDDNLAVMVIPDVTKQVQVIRDAPGSYLEYRVIESAGITLVLEWTTDDRRVPSHLSWFGSDHLVHDSTGAILPGVGLTLGDQRVTIFQDPVSGFWATFPEELYLTSASVRPDPDGAEVRLRLAPSTSMSVGRLPPGATQVTVTPRGSATWTVGAMPDGRVWYLVRGLPSSSADVSTTPLVKSISYTDTDGKRVAYTPALR